MSSQVNFLFISFLLLSSLLFASITARPMREFPDQSPKESGQAQMNGFGEMDRVNEETIRCNNGDEECLMRRTLAAHVDYIYTQKGKNP